MNFFKLSNWKRILILSVTSVAVILSIILGSFFYVGKPGNVKKSIEYGGGVKYVVKISNDRNSHVNAADVAESIYERIDALGVGGANIATGTTDNGKTSTVTVEYPGVTTEAEKETLQKTIIEKPRLVLTDIYSNPLFNENGNFNTNLQSGVSSFVGANTATSIQNQNPENFYLGSNPNRRVVRSRVPLANNGAWPIFVNGVWKVELTLEDNQAAQEWGKATEYISKMPSGQNLIIAWLDPDNFIRALKREQVGSGKTFYTGDLYKDAHVNGDLKNPFWKLKNFDASKYVISSASVKAPLYTKTSVLEGNFNSTAAKETARKLNFGTAKYSLDLLSRTNINPTYGENAFRKAVIAGVIVFALIAIFLIVNYGLLGALSTISISLYLFMTLLMFTIMRGEYSPETIAALIIGLGMSVDANIITFERLKSEVYSGSRIHKAHKNTNRRSLSSIFDANITTLIVAFVLFYFGTKEIVGLSITLIISIFFTLIIMLGFTRIMSTTLINTGYFEDKKHLLGIKPKIDQNIQAIFNKPNYVKTSKIFSLTSLAIITIAIIIFAIMSGVAGSLVGGMHISKEFTGGSDIIIQKGTDANNLDIVSTTEFAWIKDELINKANIPAGAIKFINGAVVIDSIKDYSVNIDSWIGTSNTITINNEIFYVASNTISGDMAKQLVKNSMYAILIAIGLVVIYTLIRFKWTYSVSAIIALIHDLLMVIALFVITRVEVSPVFVAGLLSIMGYSINDTIVTFDRVRERMNNSVGQLNKEKIISIGNQAVKDTIKRSLLTSLTTITAIVVLMSFGNATKLAFNLAMLVGLIAGTYSSIFIATYIWTKLETMRQKGIVNRSKKGFWKTKGLEEQTFNGINNFKA